MILEMGKRMEYKVEKVQNKILSIFKEVSRICEENDIRYFAVGGTCLGAVRHRGFIPWDDDLDIAIPIELVDFFLNVMEKELPEYLKIRTGFKDKNMMVPFIKIEDIRTTFIEKVEMEHPEQYKGIFIDVMPMSGVPEEKFERKIFIKKLRILYAFNCKRRCKFKACRSIKEKMLWLIIRPICYIVPQDYFLIKYWELLKSKPFYQSKLVGYTWSKALKRLFFSAEYFQKVVEMPFEDASIMCPIGWHEYLSKQFGDYLKLPKVENRKSGHEGIIDLNTSYVEYQLHPEKIIKGERK